MALVAVALGGAAIDARAAAVGDGLVVYGTGASTTPIHRPYADASNSFAAAVGAPTGGNPRQVRVVQSPARDEALAAYVDGAGTLRVLAWNGATWSGTEWGAAIATGGTGTTRRFDVAYEESGDAVILYSTNLGTNDEVAFRTWNGATSSFSGETRFSLARTNGTVVWIRLEQRIGSDQIAAAVSDGNGDLTALVWNGSAWGSEPGNFLSQTLEQVGAAGDSECFDVAWETLSGDLLVVWGDLAGASGTNGVRYATRSAAGTWSGTGGGTTPGTFADDATTLDLASSPDSDDILFASVGAGGSDLQVGRWAGTAWADVVASRDTSAATPVAGSHTVSVGWVVGGGTRRGIVVYSDSTATATGLDFDVLDPGVGWAAQQTGPTNTLRKDVFVAQDTLDPSHVMATWVDSGWDLWATRFSFDGSTVTPEDATGGTALDTNLPNQASSSPFGFAFARYVPPAVALGDHSGAEAPSQTVCWSAGATDLDLFTLSGQNTDVQSITVTVTSSTGSPVGSLATLAVTDDGGATLGSKTPVALTDTVTIGTPFPIPGAPTQYRVRITPSGSVAAGSHTFAGTVSAVGNSGAAVPSGSDATSASVTVDNQAPGADTALAATPGNGQVALAWTAPGSDYAGSIVVRSTSPIVWTPAKGTVYATGATPAAGVTVVAGNTPGPGPASTHTDTTAVNDTTYHYRVFAYDGCAIYAAASNQVAATPRPVTTVGTGSPAASAQRVCPGGASTFANAFSLQVSSAPADTITSLTTTLPAGTARAVASVDVVSWNGSSESGSLGSSAAPSGDSFTIAGLSLTAPTSAGQYRLKITPKARGTFPAGTYAVTAPVSSVVHALATTIVVNADAADATVTIDARGGPDVSGLVASAPAAAQVRLDWTNPGAGDFDGNVRIYRHTAPFTDRPADGTLPAPGTLPSGVVVLAPPASAVTYTDSAGLANGTTYHYAVFVRDPCQNWSPGAQIARKTVDPRTTAGGLAAELLDCSHALLSASYSDDFDGDSTVTFTRGTSPAGPFGTTVCSAVGGGLNPRVCADNAVAAGTTYYYRATFADADGLTGGATADSGAMAVPAGCGTATPGSTAANDAPVVSIVNPGRGAVASGTFRLQVRTFDRNGGGITSVNVATNGGAAACAAGQMNSFTRTSHLPSGNTAVWERQIVLPVGGPAASGTYLLRACATNAVGTVQSEVVPVTYRATNVGDGNLLVRDNSSQLCTDCHNLPTHSSETTTNRYGSWSTTCGDCHQPHGTRNLGLVRQQVDPPDYRGWVGPTTVVFRDRTTGDTGAAANVGHVTSDGTKLAAGVYGPCQACHTRTVDPGAPANARWRRTGNADPAHYQAGGANGTAACSDCHSHSLGFAAGEPNKPGAKCGGCHKTIFDMVKSGGQANAHRIDLDQSGDTALDWSVQATLSAVPSSQRSCLNTCHADHPHDLTSPAVATHEGNLYWDPLTNGSRAAASASRVEGTNRARTDFDPTANAGMCTRCHEKPISAAQVTTVTAAAYGGSQHDYTQNTVGATTYTWTYPLHDGSTFARNCTKCHASTAEGTAPAFGTSATRNLQTVHGSASASLLAGTTNPAGVAAGFVCYNCHGSTATPAAGAQGNRSGKNVQAQVAKTYRHDVIADAVHDGDAEFSGTYAVGTMHVSCMDCHDVHAASASNPLANAPGVTPTNGATPGAAPTSYTFTRISDPDEQYKTCFRCHSSFTGTLPTGTTNAAIPFNPANDSLHFVEADQGTVAVNTTGTAKGIWQNAQFNLASAPVMMPRDGFVYTNASLRSLPLRCSDCHGDDAADGGNAVPEGPHGSARPRMLKVPAGSGFDRWDATVSTNTLSSIWCFNCHLSTFAGTGFDGPDTSLDLHRDKHDGIACQTCHLANPHGRTESGAANQRQHLLKATRFNETMDTSAAMSSGNYQEDHGPGNNCN